MSIQTQGDASTLTFSAIEKLRKQASDIRSEAGKALGQANRDGDREAALPALLDAARRIESISILFSNWRLIEHKTANGVWNEIYDAYRQIRDTVGGRRSEIARAKADAIRADLDVLLPASAKHVRNTVRSYPTPQKPVAKAPIGGIPTNRAVSNDEAIAYLLAALADADPTIALPVYKVMVRERHLGVLRTVGDLRGHDAASITKMPGLGRTSALVVLIKAAKSAGIETAFISDASRIVPANRYERVLHALHFGLEVRFGAVETYAGNMQRCVHAVDPTGGDRALAYNGTDGVAAGIVARAHTIKALVSENGNHYALTELGKAEAIRLFGAR